MHFRERNYILIEISLGIHGSSIENKSEAVRVMSWRRTGDKPLPESMFTQFTDAYVRHPASMC